jgi:integrase
MKIDPYNHKEKYLSWKNSINGRIPNLSEKNSRIVLNYVFDMEHGINVASGSRKGARGYPRLNNLRQRVIFLINQFEKRYGLTDITKTSERTLHEYFTGVRNGVITRLDGKPYKSPADYVKVFKAFWHWHQKVNRKKGIEIHDITIDLDTSKDKPKWVYITEEQIKKLVDNAKFDYKVLMMFLYDSGIRSPTELMNIKVSDFYNDFKELNIRDEISKTFGRRIKLMLSSELIKDYILHKDLKTEDYLFTKEPATMNRYLRRLAMRILGDGVSPAGQKYSELTMYDFRHCSCCYWLPRYKSESALKFRFGWKKSDKIHYYSEMLGMRDTITDEDLLVDLTKTEIEKQLIQSENKNKILNDRVQILEGQMKEILELVKRGELIISSTQS